MLEHIRDLPTISSMIKTLDSNQLYRCEDVEVGRTTHLTVEWCRIVEVNEV
jgi:hypothetical protein